MYFYLKKGLAGLFFSINVFLTLFGFSSLYHSPYTGIRFTVCEQAACVKSVDANSPAYQKVKAKDILVDIDGAPISYLAFNSDPDYIRSRRDLLTFWTDRQKLSEVTKDGNIRLHLERDGRRIEVILTPSRLPLHRALLRMLPLYLAGWTFITIAYLVLRRKVNEIAIVNFIIGLLVCMNFVTLAPFSFRDIYYPFDSFRILLAINTISYFGFSYAVLHLMLIFPNRKKILLKRPWLITVPYILFVVTAILHFGELFENTHMTTFVVTNVCMLLFFSRLLYDYFKEKNTVYKKQIQWVVFGIIGGITFWLSMTSIPILFGAPLISEELSVLPTVIYPLCFAFAVTKYRLMDIESIFDYAVVYGFTIIVLEGVELIFLNFASPFIVSAGLGLPSVSLLAVLLIVFIYVPVRNRVRGLVDRLFRYGSYDIEKEIRNVTVSLGLCDNVPALEKFVSFVQGLLKPSGIFVVEFGPSSSASVLYADGERTQLVSRRFLSLPGQNVWSRVSPAGSCRYGYELTEKQDTDNSTIENELENSLFVPFFPDSANRARGFLAVLLKKRGDASYSKKDRTLLNAVSLNIANIIAAGELRRERDEIEERFRKEKEYVVKELHDGLGNILTSITVASQAARRVFKENPERAAEIVGRMNDYSAEAMDFLRTGLLVLDNPNREIGDILESIRARFSELFSAYGLELYFKADDAACRFKPGAAIALDFLRCMQETLTNVIKHSDAKNVEICLTRAGEYIQVVVRDDGRGFSISQQPRGLGLNNMASRMQKLGGRMEIVSSPGKGAAIKLVFPAAENGGDA